MSDQNQASEIQQETATESEQRKYAGKFDTIEQLEEGYKNSAKVYQENEALKKQVESFAQVPNDYMQPEGVVLGESELNDIKQIAKNAGLTQAHFEKVAREMSSRSASYNEKFQQNVKDLGEEKLNVLKDYVSKNYPGKLAEKVLREVINDPEARQAALEDRERKLNSSVPGLSSVNVSASYTVTHDDVLKAKAAYEAKTSNLKLRDQYLKLTTQYAEQKKR